MTISIVSNHIMDGFAVFDVIDCYLWIPSWCFSNTLTFGFTAVNPSEICVSAQVENERKLMREKGKNSSSHKFLRITNSDLMAHLDTAID